MSRNRVISLADVPDCSAAITAFYDQYRVRIANIETVEQRNGILAEMQENFQKRVKQEPQSRNKLSEVYQLLKRKCWEVELCGNQ